MRPRYSNRAVNFVQIIQKIFYMKILYIGFFPRDLNLCKLCETLGSKILIGQFHVSENILINCLIALTSQLDARKNVLQPMGIQRSMGIKQPSQTKHTV